MAAKYAEGTTVAPDRSQAEIIWAAGMFEGEGTVTITRSRRYTRPLVDGELVRA